MTFRQGEIIEKYRILRPLGEGGEGSVWLAAHVLTDKPWAIKELATVKGEEAFHELNVLKKLRHESLPAVADVISCHGRVCLVMEYVRGKTLDVILREKGCLTWQQTVDAGIQICAALEYLHSLQPSILHLDLKPTNLILNEKGRLVLVDFGAALTKSGGKRKGPCKGTKGFAAPEQYSDTAPLDERTDVYGMGAVLFTLISGVTFSGFMSKSKVPGCPDELGEIIRKSLNPDPGMRYENAAELRMQLTGYRKSHEWQKRRTKVWGALALALLSAALALGAVRSVLRKQLSPEWDYDRLLLEAECVEADKGLEYYQKAVYMSPEREEAYLQLIRRMDADGKLTKEEDEALRTLLYTIPFGESRTYEDMLAAVPEVYGKIALEIGMIYRYDYEPDPGEGRRWAAGWFEKAAKAAKTLTAQPSWARSATIYAHMSTYEQSLHAEENAQGEVPARVWFEDLKSVPAVDLRDCLSERKSLQLILDAMDKLTMIAARLVEEGIAAEEIETVAAQLAALAGGGEADEDSEQIVSLRVEILERKQELDVLLANLRQKKVSKGRKDTQDDG